MASFLSRRFRLALLVHRDDDENAADVNTAAAHTGNIDQV